MPPTRPAVAVARDDVDEVVERLSARRCVGVEEPALIAARVGEADGRRDALTEGPVVISTPGVREFSSPRYEAP